MPVEHITCVDGGDFRQWLGKIETRFDTVTAWPVAALAATLNLHRPPTMVGDPVPLGWHWLYFLDTAPTSQLDVDGHPRRGQFLPAVGLPRRMSAGGRLEFRQPLLIGEEARRVSEIVRIEPKRGRSGALVFVTVRHEIFMGSELSVIEEHDLVFREEAKPGEVGQPGAPVAEIAKWQYSVAASSVLLFRYSALTFMAHRIHYDVNYAKSKENYPDLVVQGPLQTILLLELCRQHARPVRKLEYRALHPVFGNEEFTANGIPALDGSNAVLWIANSSQQYAMKATALF